MKKNGLCSPQAGCLPCLPALGIKAAIQSLPENKERNCLPESPVLSFVQASEPAVEAGDLTVGN